LKWLQKLLLRKLQENSVEYFVDENSFRNYIDIVLSSVNEGFRLISVQPYHLKKSKKLGYLIDFRFKKNPDTPFNREVQRLSLSLDKSYSANKKYYTNKYHIIRKFIEDDFAPLFPISFPKGNGKITIQNDFEKLEGKFLDKKTYIFSNNRKSSSQFMGLKGHKPLKPIQSKIRYAFIFEPRFKDFANDVFLGLLGKKFGGTFAGVNSLFGVNFHKSDVTRISINTYDKQSLRECHSEVEKLKSLNPNDTIIGIFITPREEVNVEDTTAYYYLKHLFASSKIPLQVVNYDHLSNYITLKWSLANIGLQMFCKLGGIPWKVQPSNEKCLILGLGSSHRYLEDGTIQKYFGYSVCLDSSGIFKKINVLAYDEDRDNYLINLKNELVSTINNNLGSEYDKCALHLPFKIKREEIEAIQESLKEVNSEKRIDFRVIKINTENKFFGFSTHNTRIPYESTYIRLSYNEYLAWFEGLQFGKENVHKKIGNPVHIQFLRRDEETDLQDETYLQDIINLSGANWRGFNSKLIPISIYYSSLIAKYAKEFEEIDDVDVIKKEISSISSPWFL